MRPRRRLRPANGYLALTIAASVGCGERESTPSDADAAQPTPDAAQPPIPEDYVRIEPGDFTMGSPENELRRIDNESLHRVTLMRAFALKATEVTQAEWRAVIGNDPSEFADCGDTCPVEMVSWIDAVDYVNRLSDMESCPGATRMTLSERSRA